MYKHQKQRKHPWPPPSPQTPVLGEQPAAGEAASGTVELLELSSCSGNFSGLWALPGGLFLQLLVFPHLFCVLVLRGKRGKRARHPGRKKGGGTREPKEWPPLEVKSRVSRRPEKGQKVAGETGRRQVIKPAGLSPGSSVTGANLLWETHLTASAGPTSLSLPHLPILGVALNCAARCNRRSHSGWPLEEQAE